MKEQIKNLRIKIDALAQLTRELKPIKYTLNEKELEHYNNLYNGFLALTQECNSKEIEKAYDSLILAKAWLGKVLQELGEPTPYANDGQRKTVEDIEPTADTVKILEEEKKYIADKPWNDMNHIEKVDWLRQEIQYLIRDTDYITSGTGRVYIYGLRVEQYLSEARFWLGFEMQRIKNN